MSKYLITGASGLLGRGIMRQFPHDETTGLAFSRAGANLVKCDLRDPSAVSECINMVKPKVIVHVAAECSPEICESNPEIALKLNVESTRHLAQCAKEIDAYFIYISSDYVFDGTKPPYSETDTPNPVNFYGKSKFAAEQAVADTLDHYAILRIPTLYGQIEKFSESAVTTLIPKLDETSPSVDNYATRFPTLVDNVGRTCLDLSKLAETDKSLSGIFHYSGNEPYTKYELLKIMAQYLNKPFDHVTPLDKPTIGTVPRPENSQLIGPRLVKLGIDYQSVFKEAISDLI